MQLVPVISPGVLRQLGHTIGTVKAQETMRMLKKHTQVNLRITSLWFVTHLLALTVKPLAETLQREATSKEK